tara:strand:- start:197 stop:343 length:147 start_codon:yes stop_codon:yes gene_type:complete
LKKYGQSLRHYFNLLKKKEDKKALPDWGDVDWSNPPKPDQIDVDWEEE